MKRPGANAAGLMVPTAWKPSASPRLAWHQAAQPKLPNMGLIEEDGVAEQVKRVCSKVTYLVV